MTKHICVITRHDPEPRFQVIEECQKLSEQGFWKSCMHLPPNGFARYFAVSSNDYSLHIYDYAAPQEEDWDKSSDDVCAHLRGILAEMPDEDSVRIACHDVRPIFDKVINTAGDYPQTRVVKVYNNARESYLASEVFRATLASLNLEAKSRDSHLSELWDLMDHVSP